jgi:signal peptidase II
VSGPTRPDGDSELDQPHLPAAPASPDAGPVATPTRAVAAGRPTWALFMGLAAAIVVVDQLSKVWVTASIQQGSAVRLLGDLVRLIHSHNSGALFGLFGSTAPVLAVASVVVIGLIVWFHARSGRNPVISIALGLLLGGALGNLIDRLRLGYVVDWVDMGIGAVRFWTFNLGDSAISVAILLLLLIALVPGLGRASTDG